MAPRYKHVQQPRCASFSKKGMAYTIIVLKGKAPLLGDW